MVVYCSPEQSCPGKGSPSQLFCEHNGEGTSRAQSSFSRHVPHRFRCVRALPKLASMHYFLKVNVSVFGSITQAQEQATPCKACTAEDPSSAAPHRRATDAYLV